MKECKCQVCGREYIYNRTSGHTTIKCNSCMVNLRRFKIKEKCLKIKGGECKRCGYSKCSRALTFHHINPATKKFNISGSHSRKWVDIEAELNKCILLCHNCHNEYHSGMWNIVDIS